MVWIVDNIEELLDIFISDVALADPVSFALFAIGAAVTGLSLAAFGALAAGGLVTALTRD